MIQLPNRRPSYAAVMSTVAVVLAAGGVSWAASLPKNSVGSAQVKNGSIRSVDVRNGTLRQVEIAREECYCPVDVTIVPGAGHAPHREAAGATLDAIADFAGAVLRIDEGPQGRAA